MNWQIFDVEGNLYITGQSQLPRDTYSLENQNSLGVLLYQGNKKAFFAGDMNNYGKNVGGELIGDEDRLKYEIGKIDFLKLGHHGYTGSNTDDYFNVISPEYAIITNEIGNPKIGTLNILELKEVNYLYSTQDEYEVCAIIYNDDVTLGFGTPGIKKVKNEIFYIPENKIYSNYLKSKIQIKYDYIEKSVNNWDELKNTIEQFKYREGIYIQDNFYIIEGLIITLNTEKNNNVYNANSSILVDNFKNVKMITNQNEIVIKRDKSLIELPLFQIEKALLTFGEENMKGKIIIDGNKENVVTISQLIRINYGELSIYDNIVLCNNLLRISDLNENTSNLIYGSAIFAQNYSKINIYGGEISNNTQELLLDKSKISSILPEIMTIYSTYDMKGVIFLSNSTLNMLGGKICFNKCINNSYIYSNENSTNNDTENTYAVYQRCLGTAIYADYISKVYLRKGEISNNIAENNAKINLITPKEGKKTKLSAIYHSINGSAIYGYYCFFEIFDDFLIENNSSKLNSTININENCSVSGSVNNGIEGGQLYLYLSKIKINGGIIKNSNNVRKLTSNISPDENGDTKSVFGYIYGGAMYIFQCKNFEINNLKINKCKSDYKGGAIYFNYSTGKVNNSEFSYDISAFGGAIYCTDTCNVLLYNTKILNNSTEGGSGGGIYAYGELTIDGEKSNISNNVAETYGGGIMIKTKAKINNCIICNNKASKNSGGGINVDGELTLNNAKIYKNWCNQRGGGIRHEDPNSKHIYHKDKIKNIVYNNKANEKGNDIFPELEEV